ncbi:nitroreductase family protein [uncultured Peptoniphilus sp.]|uniref:nitroreductase family protein n=1 Tax=uncultured Peptoniphilus sp. TaxID=254354 RepID=UPI002805298B|nr:nitroreductase family protein [uncultured Peptoniphilus sp.]
MLMTNFLQERKSVRDFKNNALSKDLLYKIKDYMANVNDLENSAKFYLYENGGIISKALQGKAGYSGVMIEAPHYIGLEMDKSDYVNILKSGYLLEKLNTEIVKLDLGTCWITLSKVDNETKKSVFGESGNNIDYLIALGYPKKKKLFEPEVTQERYTLDQLIFKDDIDSPISGQFLEQRGLFNIFSSIRYAPSHKNFQPWRFVIKDEKVYAYMKKSPEDKLSLVDMGVILFYFEEMAKTIGITNKWNIEITDEENYLNLGYFAL